jgi:tetratricopeptide (TPR) repeat protein
MVNVDNSNLVNPICNHCGTTCGVDAKTCHKCGEVVAPPAPDPFIGTCIGDKYDIDIKLGEGGMGSVYKARQRPIDRPVCLKVINPGLVSDPTVFRRFQMEAEMASKVKHPSAVEIYDFASTSDGNAIIVMEYVPGILLTEIIEKQFPIPPERTIRILSHVCDVLEVGHRMSVIHRDLKPDNIMVFDLPTENDFAKLLDYGIAKSDDQQAGATQLTMAGTAIGTPEYMAPEQITGQPIGPFTDVYALGVILYYMLCGALPFEGSSPVEFFTKHVREEPVPPSRRGRVSGIHPELEKLVMWCLKKRAEERTPSMLEFKRTMEKALPSRIETTTSDASETSDLMKNLLGDAVAAFGGRVELEKRKVVIAFFDLILPEDAISPEAKQAFMAKAVDVAERYNGHPEQLSGSRFAIIFGFRQTLGDEVTKALMCSQDLLAMSTDSSAAMHFGPIELGTSGMVYGKTVEEAERAAMYVAAGQVVALDPFRELATNVQFRGMAPLELKGQQESLSIFEVISVNAPKEAGATVPISVAPTMRIDSTSGENASDAAIESQKTAALRKGVVGTDPSDDILIGREDVLAQFQSGLETVLQGVGAGLIISGPPGIGKTRTIKEFESRNPDARHCYVSCRDPKVIATLLNTIGIRECPLEHRMFLNWILGSAFEPPPGLGADEVMRGIVAAVHGQITLASAEGPTVIVLDDLELANEVMQSVVHQLLIEVSALNVLFVLSGRYIPTNTEDVAHIQLGPLNDEESSKLLGHLIAGDPGAQQTWLSCTGGIPSAIRQLAQAANEGTLPPGGDVDSSMAIQAVLEARLNALSPECVGLIAIAAAIGESCSEEILLNVASDVGVSHKDIEILLGRGLLMREENSDRLRFSSATERHIAYARIPSSRITTIHQRAAVMMEEAGEPPEFVAAQFEGAGDLPSALGRLRQAALMWVDQKERQRAVACYQRAYELAIGNPGQEKRAAEDALALARLLQEQGRLVEGEEILGQAEEAAQSVGDAGLAIQIASERVRIMISKNDFRGAEQRLSGLMQEGNQTRDVALLSDLMGLAGECAEQAGHDDAAVQRILKSIELAQQLPGEDGFFRAVRSLGRLGRIELRAQRPETAMKFFQQQKTAAEQVDDPLSEAKALVNIAAVHQSQGALSESLTALDSGLELAREVGDLLTVAKALHNGGCIRFHQGDLFEAKSQLKESLTVSQSIGWKEGVAMNDAWLRRLQS